MFISAISVVWLWVLPALLAAYPAICALGIHRYWMAAGLFVAGLFVAFLGFPWLALYVMATGWIGPMGFHQMLLYALAFPMVGAVLYAVIGTVIVAVVEKKPFSGHDEPKQADPPGGVAPWIQEMRRKRSGSDEPPRLP